MTSNYVLFLWLVLSVCFTPSHVESDYKSSEWQSVRQIILGNDRGDGEIKASRWLQPAKLRAIPKTSSQKKVILASVEKINRILSKTMMSVSVDFSRDEKFNIQILVAPIRNGLSIPNFLQCPIKIPKDQSQACILKSKKTAKIGLAFAWINDQLEKTQFETAVLRELFRSLGLNPIEEKFNEESYLKINLRALNFLYSYLSPGDDEATVRQKFEKNWHAVSID